MRLSGAALVCDEGFHWSQQEVGDMKTVSRVSERKMLIGGRWVASSGGESFESMNPATGQPVALIPKGNRRDAEAAVAAANDAKRIVAQTPVFDRSSLCHEVADRMLARAKNLARELSEEQGKPYEEAVAEVQTGARFFRDYAETVTRMETDVIPSPDPNKRVITIRQPHGVVAVITPWNYPIGIPSYYLASAIAGGNAIVWKPAPTTSAIAARLAQCVLDAGVPEGALNLVYGDAEVGDEIVSNPGTHAIGFTGSSAVGRHVAQRAGPKPLLLELGGNGPVIILDDADTERAVKGTTFGCFSNAGQICQSSERILVHEKLHDAIVEGLVEEARTVRLGNPLEDGTTMGPLNNEGVAHKVDLHVADAVGRGAAVLTGGRRAHGFPTPLFYEPTVIDHVTPEALLNEEETFGPVAPVMSIADVDEAIAVANRCSLGLLCSVYTRNLRRAFFCAESLECGVVNVNETPAYWDGRTPFGGYSGKSSGVGRLGGKATLLAMTQNKSIVMDISTTE
jgi:acyl-CoA reductase-like NAD-dependent aldehyde dehydrogenase